MRPLRVTAFMSDGRMASIDGRLHLDSMLAYGWIAENHPELLRTNLAATDRMIPADLSDMLEQRGTGDDYYWACSAGVFSQIGETIEYFHKRLKPKKTEKWVDFGKRRGRVVVAGGPYKAWRHPVVVRLTSKVVWYCVGHANEIERVLREHIHYIGKYRGRGYGLVRKCVVEPWEDDWSVYGPDGELMRAIPDRAGVEVRGIRPPYWAPANQRLCLTPEVEL
jgi:CRISPR type IV-associated protein Csf3